LRLNLDCQPHMKVLIFINTSWNIYNFRAGMIRSLIGEGYQVHALAPEDPYSNHLIALGCVYHPIEMSNTGSNPVQDLLLMSRLYRVYRKIQPQVVLHYTIKPNIYGSLVAGLLKIPTICTVSGLGTVFLTSSGYNSIAKLLYKWAFRYPGRIYFQNQDDLNLFKHNGLLLRQNYHLIPGSGVDTRRFTPEVDPQSGTPFVFLMMARLIEEKGVLDYLQAAELLRSQGINAIFQLIGARDPHHKRGIDPRLFDSGPITYLGEQEDVRLYLRKAHVVVLPSYREGLSRALLEAAAMGKPIVTSDVPGCREVVKDQINGLLCRPTDPEDLAAKMRAIFLMTDSERLKLGAKGRQLVVENYSEEKVVGIYIKTIGELTTN